MLGQNNNILWTDIASLYNRINTERLRFGYNQKTVPSNQNTITKTETIQDLKNAIETMTSYNSTLASIASTASITTPSAGDILRPTQLTGLSSIVDRISQQTVNTNNFTGFNGTNFSGFNSNHNAGFFSCFTFDFSDDGTFRSSHNGSHNSGNFSCFTHNGGHNGSHNSSVSAQNGATFWSAGFENRSGFNSSHNGSFNAAARFTSCRVFYNSSYGTQ